MDDKPAPLAPPAPAYPQPPQYPQGPRPPGRPPDDPIRAEAASKQVQQQRDLEAMLPLSAIEPRVHVYRMNPRTGLKSPSSPIHKIMHSKMSEMNPRKDPGLLNNYLREKFGPGLYQLEPCDNHGMRIEKLASWQEAVTISGDAPSEDGRAGQSMDPRDFENDDVEDDDENDDPRGKRGKLDLGAFIMEASQQQQTTAKSSADLMQIMMMQQAEQRRQEREDERKADERREEARRRDESNLAAERKADEERRREERRQDDDRRREESKREDDRRREDRDRDQRTQETRMATLTALITAGSTLLAKVLEPKPKEDHMTLKVMEMLNKNSNEDMTKLLLSKVLDNGNNKALVEQMTSGATMASKMQADMFSTMMKTSTEMQGEMYKKQLEALKESGDGGSDTLDKVINLVGKAGSLFQNVLPQGQQGAPGAPGQPGLPAPQQQPQAQQQQRQRPTGTEAVVRSMIALQTGRAPDGRTLTDDDRGQVATFLIDEMPDELSVAIINNDQAKIQEISQPVIMANPQFISWISKAGVMEWIGSFFDQLRPELVKMQEAETAPAPAPVAQEAPPAPPQAAQAAEPIPGPGATTAPPAPSQEKRRRLPGRPPKAPAEKAQQAKQAQAVAASGAPEPIPLAEPQPAVPAQVDGDDPV